MPRANQPNPKRVIGVDPAKPGADRTVKALFRTTANGGIDFAKLTHSLNKPPPPKQFPLPLTPEEMKRSPFQQHCLRWRKGCGSEFCKDANRVVLYRGKMPCDILIVGEAPGDHEDIHGIPFIGPAGDLLNDIIAQSISQREDIDETNASENFLDNLVYRVGITNLVGCRPHDGTGKKDEPTFEQIEDCKPRVEEIIQITRCRLVIAVGKHTKDALTPGALRSHQLPSGVYTTSIMHPAWILRQQTASQGWLIQQQVHYIQDALKRFLDADELPDPKLPTDYMTCTDCVKGKYPTGETCFRCAGSARLPIDNEEGDHHFRRPAWDTDDIPF